MVAVKKIMIGLVVLALIAGGVLLNAKGQKNEPDVGRTSAPALSAGNGAANAAPGVYTDYGSIDLSRTTGTKILFFYAPWCPQCRALEADIEANGPPAGVTIVKVDYDKNQTLRKKYGVTIQTTLVKIDDNGDLVKKYVAYDEPNLQAVKENLL